MSDDTPTPKLTERHIAFATEARRVAAEVNAIELRISHDLRVLDVDEGNFARALKNVLELHAKRIDKWAVGGGIASMRKQRQLAELQSLTVVAKEFCAEHKR